MIFVFPALVFRALPTAVLRPAAVVCEAFFGITEKQ
jgi:hypothetical protein